MGGFVLLFVVLLGLAKFASVRSAMAEGAKHAPPPASVSTVVVQQQTWDPVLSAVGSLKAVNGVTVSTDMGGIVSEIAFKSGADVKKGDLLVRLDTQQEEAQLQSALAKLDLARADIVRKRDLIAKKAIAPSDLDTAESMLHQTEAAVTESKAIIARKRITAPFDGSLGIRMVDIGQYINMGTAFVALQSLDPIHVQFSIPQQRLDAIAVGGKLRIRATGLSDDLFEGEITAVDSHLDEATRNLMVEGTLPNPDHKLRAGMFASVEVLLPSRENVLAIPSSAVNFQPYGNSVFVVVPAIDSEGKPMLGQDHKPILGADGKPGKVVKEHFVKLGVTRGDQVEVISGIKPGEELVSAGVFRLHSDAPVRVNNSVQPGNELNPKPADT